MKKVFLSVGTERTTGKNELKIASFQPSATAKSKAYMLSPSITAYILSVLDG